MAEDDLAAAQLDAIATVVRIASDFGGEVWLRGGWAMDFLLGRVTRPHADVDFFAWSDDIDQLTEGLTSLGFTEVPGPPVGQQRDFIKDDVDVSFALIARGADGEVLVAGGPHEGEPWPPGILTGPASAIGDVVCPVISAEAQIEIKEMMPVWVPGVPRRSKDLADIEQLRAALQPLTRRHDDES